MATQEKQLWVFGYGLPVILLILGLGHWHKHGLDVTAVLLLCASSVALLIALLNRPALEVLFKYWMKGAHFIGTIFMGAVLSALFFLVFGMVGIILRLLRKDLLDLRWNKAAVSYWKIRQQAPTDPAEYTRQF